MAITKNNHPATPIDERETFVSLQKSFADGDQNVHEKLQTLYALQQADNELDKLTQLRGELPAEVQALEAEIESMRAKYAHLEEVIEGFNQTIKTCKENIAEIDAEIEKYQQQLNNISNSREYDSLNKELENQGLLCQIAEKNISEAKASIEDRKHDLEILSGRIAIREEDLAAKKEELARIVESTAAQEATLQARRDECAAKIDARTMSAYNRIRGNVHNHLAVVTVVRSFVPGPKDDDKKEVSYACGGCFHAITPQRVIDVKSGRKLVICEHCGRIIVASE